MKQKMKLVLFICTAFFGSIFLVNKVQAAASATLSWVPPTTDEGGGALTGLTGYKIYYNTTSTWLNFLNACLLPDPVGSSIGIDVAGGSTSSYRFSNNLTPGQTYYFAVAAYDDSDNVSKCATSSGGLTEVSKRVSYSGDINKDWVVNGGDITTLAGVYFTNDSESDVNKDGAVNGGDVTVVAEDYLKPAL
ncbi:MAG: hypothetical protein ACD_20C00388G0003 [uncultured bacterium]|nr:MAG: hypothetical protein ACD_20C00388G0003 [uncultured bacterium]